MWIKTHRCLVCMKDPNLSDVKHKFYTRIKCSALNIGLFYRKVADSPFCCCRCIEDAQHFFFDCGYYTFQRSHPQWHFSSHSTILRCFMFGWLVTFLQEQLIYFQTFSNFYYKYKNISLTNDNVGNYTAHLSWFARLTISLSCKHHLDSPMLLFKWRFTGGLLWYAFNGIGILSTPEKNFLDPCMNEVRHSAPLSLSLSFSLSQRDGCKTRNKLNPS